MKVRLPQGMGGGPSNMQSMIKQAQKMQEDMAAKQAELEKKIEKPEGSAFERAVYNIDGESCSNAYPCEAVMRKKLYREDKEVQVRYYARKKCVYDRNAVITTIIGLIFGLLVTGAALYIFLIYRG